MEEDTCEYCGRIFATSKGLSNHLRGDSPCRRGVVGDGGVDDGGRWSCDKCGRCFESYMGRTQHYNASSQCAPWNRRGALTSPAGRMTHTPRSAPVDDDFTMDDDDDGPLDVESNTSSSDTDGEDLTRYVEALCEAGTYDANFVSCHLNRARHEGMTEQVLESCKFLRATETGEGCSRRQVEALLAHAHSLGGRGDLLPKGYKKLWNCVEKVCLWCPSVCMVIALNTKYTPSDCNSIKYHWPYHWSDTRRELGCSAAEKSLERKLGEVQKRNFKYTNGRNDVEVRR